jgi:hypothetical protein
LIFLFFPYQIEFFQIIEELVLYFKNYLRACFKPFKLSIDGQRWIGHGCTKHEGWMPISVENLITSFKL